MKFHKSCCILVILAIIILFIVGCGSSSNGSTTVSTTNQQETTKVQEETTQAKAVETTTEAKTEATVEDLEMSPITLTMFASFGSNIGIQSDEVSEHLREVTGITLNLINGEDEELQILMAGGDLPDIISCGNGPKLGAMIESGQLMILDDLLTQYAPNIKQKIPVALKASREFDDPAKSHIYFIRWNVSKSQPQNPNANGFVGFFTRWDLYKEIGMPEITNEDQYLTALREMVDLKPVTDDGQKVFAFSGWTDWGFWPYDISYPFANGYNGSVNIETIEPYSRILEEDDIFYKGLNFMRKANDLGLYDPEALTMTADQYGAKVSTGQVIVSAANWWQPDKLLLGEEAACYIIPGTNPYISQIFPEDLLIGYGGSRAGCIPKSNKYPERTMMLLDYMNSDIGMRNIYNGMQGTNWDYVDGIPQLIGEAREIALGNVINPDFDAPGNFHGRGRYNNFLYEVGANTASDGYPYQLGQALEFKLAAASPSDIDFASHYAGSDARIPGQAYVWFVKQGLAKNALQYPMVLLHWEDQKMEEEYNRVMNLCSAYLNENLAKFILAPSEADFNAEVKKAIEYADRMGLPPLFNTYKDMHVESNKIVSEFMAEFK